MIYILKELVLLSAAWCGPCKVYKPLLERVVPEYGYKLTIVDVGENPEQAIKYRMSSVPTLIGIGPDSDDDIKFIRPGALPESRLRDLLKEHQ